MNTRTSSPPSIDVAKAVVRRITEEVQNRGNFEVFEELFADDFVDHTPQPDTTPDKPGVRKLYKYIRAAFPDFHAEIHWQLADGDRVTTHKTYYGTHEGYFLGVAPTHRQIHFETVDVMRVENGKITDHWGVGNLLSLMQQIGGWTPACSELRLAEKESSMRDIQATIRRAPAVKHQPKSQRYYFDVAIGSLCLLGANTGGAYCLLELSLAPGMTVPRHTHTREDEAYYVLFGELEVVVGEQVFILRTGDALMAPRDIPHQLRNSGGTENHYLIMFSPSGFEEFLKATAVPAPLNAVAPTEPPAAAVRNVLQLAADFGILFEGKGNREGKGGRK